MRAFFQDTWAFLALANRRDPGREAAVAVDTWLEEERYAAVTSDFVLDEALTGLHAAGGAAVSLRFLQLTLDRIAGRELLLIEVNSVRRERALDEFRRLAPDVPRLSFTDCTSFALMRELGIELAFTADRHFLQAGLRPLVTLEGGRHAPRLP